MIKGFLATKYSSKWSSDMLKATHLFIYLFQSFIFCKCFFLVRFAVDPGPISGTPGHEAGIKLGWESSPSQAKSIYHHKQKKATVVVLNCLWWHININKENACYARNNISVFRYCLTSHIWLHAAQMISGKWEFLIRAHLNELWQALCTVDEVISVAVCAVIFLLKCNLNLMSHNQ